MAARVVGVRQERIKSLPDGAVHEVDEVRGQLHDITGKVQSAPL